MLKTYFLLTKPGIIFGNAITMIAGFSLASKSNFDFLLFFVTMIGLSLVIASACVWNNYIDKDLDQKMERTKNRPLVAGLISDKRAIIFALLTGVLGIFILYVYTNLVATGIAALGFFVYVILYSLWKKSEYATLVGSIAGATPPVVGYAAVSGTIDFAAMLLFAILVLWQMPHFYAIALYRLNDYKAAGIPVLPLVKGLKRTKVHMFFYVLAFFAALLALPLLHYTGTLFAVLSFFLGLSWLVLAIYGFSAKNDAVWARKMFVSSLVIITIVSLTIPLENEYSKNFSRHISLGCSGIFK